MSRYLQKISLRPYSDSEIWAGWELEGRDGEIEGLILADDMSDEEIAGLDADRNAEQDLVRAGGDGQRTVAHDGEVAADHVEAEDFQVH